MVSSYRDLEVWQKSIDLAEMSYRLSASFPPSERFGMTTQLRRASSSVAANIAEGAARHGTRDFLRFLGIASGSLAETETHLFLAQRLGLAKEAQLEPLLSEADDIGRMLSGLKRSLRSKITHP